MIWLGIWYLVIGWFLLFAKMYIKGRADVEKAPIFALITALFLSPVWPILLIGLKR
jgi:hypothetical protein